MQSERMACLKRRLYVSGISHVLHAYREDAEIILCAMIKGQQAIIFSKFLTFIKAT